MKNIVIVTGCRPNIVKVAPMIRLLDGEKDFNTILIHSNQHYDPSMSQIFFDNLSVRQPDLTLSDISSNTEIQKIAEIMANFEDALKNLPSLPDLVLVVGDVNTTMACSFVANRMGIKLGHIESGLRSHNRMMPEEINRIMTDHLSDLLFVTEKDAIANLLKEGIPSEKIHFVGNIMIDSMIQEIEKTKEMGGAIDGDYCYVTLHRPSNVDDFERLKCIVEMLEWVSKRMLVIFSIHKRTHNNLKKFDLYGKLLKNNNIMISEPLGYHENLNLVMNSKFVLTDSAGISEETSFLNVPCLTLRTETERPVTVQLGTNIVENDIEKMKTNICAILIGQKKQTKEIPKWDGKTAERIIEILKNLLQKGEKK